MVAQIAFGSLFHPLKAGDAHKWLRGEPKTFMILYTNCFTTASAESNYTHKPDCSLIKDVCTELNELVRPEMFLFGQ